MRRKRINRFQAGGEMTPLAYYIPDRRESLGSNSGKYSSSTTVKSGDDKKEKQNYALSKNDIAKAFANILPSDMYVIKNDAIKVMNMIDLNDELDGMFSGEINRMLTELQMKISVGQQAKTDFEASRTNITNNKAQAEVAITKEGYVMYLDKDKNIKYMSPSNINDENRSKLLTYEDLAFMRKNVPAFAYDERILDTLRQSQSMDDIMKDIYNVVDKLGSVKTDETSLFAKKQGNYITKGLELIVRDGDDGIYRIQDSKDVTTREQKMYAVQTVLANMPKSKQNAIAVRAKLNGTTPEDIVFGAIAMHEKPQFTRTITHSAFPKGSKDGDKDGSSSSKSDITSARAVQEMYGDIVQFNVTNGHDNNFAQNITASAIKVNVSTDERGLTNLSKMKESSINGAVDWNNASIAGQHVDESRLGEFITSNTAFVMYLPYTYDANSRVVVDFDNVDKVKAANSFIRNKYGTVTADNYEKVNADMEREKFNLRFDSNGNPMNANMRKFVGFNVNAGYNTFNRMNLEESPHVHMTESNIVADRIAKSTGIESDDGRWTIPFGWLYEDLTGSAVIFMPTYSSAVNASIGTDGTGLKEDLGTDAGQMDKALQEHKQKPKFQKPNIEI